MTRNFFSVNLFYPVVLKRLKLSFTTTPESQYIAIMHFQNLKKTSIMSPRKTPTFQRNTLKALAKYKKTYNVYFLYMCRGC